MEALRLLSSSRVSLLQQVKERLHQTHVPIPRVRMVEKGAVLIPGWMVSLARTTSRVSLEDLEAFTSRTSSRRNMVKTGATVQMARMAPLVVLLNPTRASSNPEAHGSTTEMA